MSTFTDSQFTDSHCHLDFTELAEQLDNVLATCQQRNIKRIIVPSIGPQNWQSVLSLTTNTTDDVAVYPCLGIHPWFLDDLPADAISQLDLLVNQHKQSLIALGEMGVDGTIAKNADAPEKNLAQQIDIFEQQLLLADKHQLPVIVHHRRSHQEVVRSLKKAKLTKGGIVHAFSGSYQQAKQYLDLGFLLGIGGTITYPRAAKTINTVKKLPIEAMVLETDAPSMPLAGFQGQANHPKHVTDVFDTLASLRSEERNALAEQLEKNIDQLFGFNR
ncbi:TatD family deoxyribonuclease [Thalassotalea euphylliae]|uniref:TatD family deoxyribonuclease n=1 Tax=Thalassotalea euphylliae TaxID=1655234 RepID=A0A3E0TUU0_9GAMM|nr:TatD family hydrolase [Thalassotalea euphylliae]REL28137.1 TatD family deoxyribonuclease [Thalassotalea euphylliae]